ncbi:MAG: DUF433 domain-containing protein, partial [Chloroflexota bacterium]
MVDRAYNVTESHITRTKGLSGGKSVITGTRIRVQDVYMWHEMAGRSADKIAADHELTLSQVYAALTYAFDNLEAIQQDIRESDAFVENL